MKRAERLKLRRDFLTVQSSPHKGIAKSMVVQVRATAPDAPLRVGFTVTKKIGNAVVRNRARRRLRAVADLVLTHGYTGYDIAIVARADALTRDFLVLADDLRYALRKAGVVLTAVS